MNLSRRMLKIIELIPPCDLLADVGCDHGMVGISALIQNKTKKVIFIDISQPSLKKAENLARQYSMLDKCEFVVGDGLCGKKVDCAIIAGMGGKEILKILENSAEKPQYLLLNPMRNTDTVREKIVEDYRVSYDEKFLDKKFYDLMFLVRGSDELSTLEIKYGRTNLEFFCEDFCCFLRQEQIKYAKILKDTQNSEIESYLKEIETLLYRSKNVG